MFFFILSFSSTGHADPVNHYFDQREVRSDDLSSFTKWQGMLHRYEQQRRNPDRFCKNMRGACRVTEWRKLIVALRGKPVARQLAAVNRFFNRLPYASDREIWGKADFWATPYEFLTREGDCEDYASAKLLTLRLLGVSAERMRIVVLRDLNLGGVMHAVLEVEANGERFLLDNQMADIAPERSITHYKPIFSINEQAWWAYRHDQGAAETIPAGGR